MSVEDAAKLLHLNVKRVQSLARAGKLPAVRIGRKWLFPRDKLEALLGRSQPGAAETSSAVEISARNQLRARIVGLNLDGVMAEVRLRIGDQELVSVITRSSAERLGLAVGDHVLAVIKSTEVMIGKG
ncbi:MAG TPA: TOBE domain-containing protein [Gemmatimonadales bacterium]|nr:TOBE domain-containing protein [Gemmatimonadales bacterium]